MMKILYVLPVLAALGMLSAAHAQVDTTPPTFESGTYDKETGAMTLTFSEAIDISATKLNRMFLNGERLNSHGAIDRSAPDSATLTVTVGPPLLGTLAAADSVEIDFRRNAVADTAGNVIQASRNHALTPVEEPPDTQMPPVAPATTATTAEDTQVTITPAISDPDGDTPRISAVADPPNGSVTFDDTTVTYTPDRDYEGTDTFGYTVTDGQAETRGTITVTVTRDNNDPVLGAIGDQAASAGTLLDIVPTVTDADPTDTHTYSIGRGTLPAAAAFTESDGRLAWTPGPGDAGSTHTVTITVDDGRGGTDSETFDIAVGASDTTPPQLVSGELDMSDGTLTLVFDEVIKLSTVYTGDISLVKQDGTIVVLGSSTVDGTAGDSETVTIDVDQAALDRVSGEDTLSVSLADDSVADISDNYILGVTRTLTVIPGDEPQTAATVTITAAGRFVEDADTVEITRSDSMAFTVEFTNNHGRDHTILADTISYNDWHSGADIPIAQGETVTATFTIKDTQKIRDRPTVYFVFGVANDPGTPEHEPDTITGDHLVKIRIVEPAS